jgi:hypothetical protein
LCLLDTVSGVYAGVVSVADLAVTHLHRAHFRGEGLVQAVPLQNVVTASAVDVVEQRSRPVAPPSDDVGSSYRDILGLLTGGASGHGPGQDRLGEKGGGVPLHHPPQDRLQLHVSDHGKSAAVLFDGPGLRHAVLGAVFGAGVARKQPPQHFLLRRRRVLQRLVPGLERGLDCFLRLLDLLSPSSSERNGIKLRLNIA